MKKLILIVVSMVFINLSAFKQMPDSGMIARRIAHCHAALEKLNSRRQQTTIRINVASAFFTEQYRRLVAQIRNNPIAQDTAQLARCNARLHAHQQVLAQCNEYLSRYYQRLDSIEKEKAELLATLNILQRQLGLASLVQ